MALNGMNSGSVRFSKTAPGPSAFQRPVKKVDNFFDEDDEGQLGFETIWRGQCWDYHWECKLFILFVLYEGFETFENDKDLVKMKYSFNSKDQNDFDNMPEEENLGQALGGKAFRLTDDTTSGL